VNAMQLINEAMADVRIVICKRCRGLGAVGLPSFRTTCPECGGCGETTRAGVDAAAR
jgi:DnaJ-class molecular chaperone